MIWLVGAALAGSVAVVTPEGPVRPGTPAIVHVAAIDELGLPALDPPSVSASGGSVRSLGPVEAGVHAWLLTPPASGAVALTIEAYGASHTVDLAVEKAPPSKLVLPARMEAQAGDPEVRLLVTGADLPDPASLQVVVGEGRVLGVERVDGGLEIRMAMAGASHPRVIPIAVRDGRRDEAPLFGGIRVRTRTTIDIQTEPGAKLVLTVGKRTYGPFLADATGVVRPVIDQHPGELSAQAVLTDDLGNETRTTLALTASAQASLLALPTGPIVPGRAPPAVFLYAIHGDGHTWEGAGGPTCQTPSGLLVSELVGRGTWRVALGDLALQDVRLRCALGDAAEATVRIPITDQVPASLDLRLWPEELSTSFPVAEVQAVLTDARGERMPVDGVSLAADRGRVTLDPSGGSLLRGDYDGTEAVAHGGDVIHARYDLPAGSGPVAQLLVSHGDASRSGRVRAHVRALDPLGRPVAGVEVEVWAADREAGALQLRGEAARAVTGADGWAAVDVQGAPGLGPVQLVARTAHREGQGIALRDSRGGRGPGTPDLAVERRVAITAGRVSLVDVRVEPEILYTGPRAFAKIEVHISDRAGAALSEPPDAIEVSAGEVGPWQRLPDGGFVADYHPPPGDMARTVDITVRADTASTRARVQLEPRPIDRSAMFGVGVISNFGEIFSPFLAADLDVRSPLFGRTVMIRLGVGYYGDTTEVDTGIGQPASLRTSIVPITLGLLARGDYRGDAVWGGLGAVVAPHLGEGRFGNELHRYVSVYPPGLAMMAGAGRRLGVGELYVEVRATALSSPGGDFAFAGPVGGVASIVGYRVVY